METGGEAAEESQNRVGKCGSQSGQERKRPEAGEETRILAVWCGQHAGGKGCHPVEPGQASKVGP